MGELSRACEEYVEFQKILLLFTHRGARRDFNFSILKRISNATVATWIEETENLCGEFRTGEGEFGIESLKIDLDLASTFVWSCPDS